MPLAMTPRPRRTLTSAGSTDSDRTWQSAGPGGAAADARRAANVSRSSAGDRSAAAVAADRNGTGVSDVTYFFPNPTIKSTEMEPGLLAFSLAESEARYLSEHVPSAWLSGVGLLMFLTLPAALVCRYHFVYVDKGLATMSLLSTILIVEGGLALCALLHVWARAQLSRRGNRGLIVLQRVDCVLACLLGLGLNVWEVLAAENMRYQGYFHALQFFLITFCLTSRHLVFRTGAVAAWFNLCAYSFAAIVGSLEHWPVEHSFEYNTSAVPGYNYSVPGTPAPEMMQGWQKDSGLYRPRSVSWYTATIDNPFGQTDNGAMFLVGVISAMLCLGMTIMNFRAELAERAGWEASTRLGELFDLANEQDRKLEHLLQESIPAPIVPLLKEASSSMMMQAIPDATVIAVEMVGFEEFADRSSASEGVALLNMFYSELDAVIKTHGCEKIKASSGSLMIVMSGLPIVRQDHAAVAAECATELVQVAFRLAKLDPSAVKGVRVGLHSGPVVSGMLGTGPLLYDVWGDAVPTAIRVMKTAEVSSVKLSQVARDQLQKQYNTEEKGAAVLKNGRRTKTYVLQARRYGNEFAKFQVNLDRIKGAQVKAEPQVAVNISDSVRVLCAYPARTDWSVLREEPAKAPKQFSDGLKNFGSGLPFPEFRQHRQHGWEASFKRMQVEASLYHHQMTLLGMLFAFSAGVFWQQRWCEPIGLCSPLTLDLWIKYLLVTIPLVLMMALVVFFTRLYLKASNAPILVLVIANFVALITFAKAKGATPPAEVGYYSIMGVLFYVYFGGYMQTSKAVFAALIGSAVVFVNFHFASDERSEETRKDLMFLHVAIHVPGALVLAAYERGRRLYFGWWTLLRKSQEDKKGTDGPGRCEKVLYLRLPNQITTAVNRERSLMAHEYPDAAVLVIDIAGFTNMVTPPQFHQSNSTNEGWMQDDRGNKVALVTALLSDIVSLTVQLTVQYDVLFARISGATMVVAAGIPEPSSDHACRLAHLAFDLIGFVTELCGRRMNKIAKHEGTSPSLGLQLRMGLAVGEVKSGLVGFHKFNYDLWGQAMEMADALQMIANPNNLQCNARARHYLVSSGDFYTENPRDVLIRGSNPKPSYEVERANARSFVPKPSPQEPRFWNEYEADGEKIIIDMIRIAETRALHTFVQSLQLQTKMRLTGKQGVQLESREQEQAALMEEITLERCGKEGFESAAGWVDPVPDRLSGVAAGINEYMDDHIQRLRIQHGEENEKIAVELKAQSRDFVELIADQRPQIELGSRMNGVLHINKLTRLVRMDVFSLPDAYVVVYWNGEHIGDTEVVKDDLNPEFHETDFEIAFYSQLINTLELEVYDWAEGLNPDGEHTFLGRVSMTGRGTEFLPITEKDFALEDTDDPTVKVKNVAGEIHLSFEASHDREVEERMLEVWLAVDDDGNGALDRDEMFEVLQRMGETDINMDKVMAEVDEDNSGEVDFDEFRKWFFLQDTAAQGAMHAKDSITTAERIFQQVDIDNSGDVSFDEFSSWWSARAKGAAAEKGEPMDDKELEYVLEHSLELFHKYDVDGGGGLDPEEFAAMIRDMAYEEWFPASSNGRQYFFNIKTQETRWTLPELGEELLDKFVDRQATLEVSGDKAASKLMTNIDNELTALRQEASVDAVVQRKIMTLASSKRIMIQQFVDVATILFDANSQMVDAFVRSMDEDTIEREGVLLKMKTLAGGGVEWKQRYVELHKAPKGRRIVYRKKKGKREMHALELVGCRYAEGVWKTTSMDQGGECWEDTDLTEAGGLDNTTGRRAMHTFTIIALEPYVVGGKTHFEEDCYVFACGNEHDLAEWIETLALPVHKPPVKKEEAIDVEELQEDDEDDLFR